MSDKIKNQIELFHSNNISIESRSILLSGEVGLDMFQEFFKNFHVLDATDGSITIYINSEGGDLDQGKAIYDIIKNSKRYVRGVVYGEASSAASLILQACDERTMSENSYIMVHLGEEATGGHPSNKKRWDKKYEKDTDWMMKVYLEKIKEKKPRFTKNKLTEMLRFDTILSAKEAIDLGLLDRVEE